MSASDVVQGPIYSRHDGKPIYVGDTVTRSARGVQWIVTEFWLSQQGVTMASLKGEVGTATSCPVAQLRKVKP